MAVLAPGTRVIIRGEEWLVRASLPVNTGGYAVRTVGLSELVRNVEAVFLTQLDEAEEIRAEDTRLVPDPSPRYRRSRLFLESLLRRTPPTDDRIYLGHRAALNFANYQMAPAHKALSGLRPSILIADGVGIGKTLEVGVLLSELIKRGRGERILVVALKSLLTQFQQELWSRFTIPLVRLDSEGLQRARAKIPANKNPFYYFNKVIISIDTLKNDGRYRTFLEQCRWDVIVIDECHHVANAGNQRNRLASLLARTTDSLIFTSATPHNGRPESFANLMNMLDPTAVADPTDYTKEEIQGLFVRRFKKDIANEVGEHFRTRLTEKFTIQATTAEEKVFGKLHRLQFNTLDRRGHGSSKDHLFSTTLMKAFLSSPQACLETVQNRLSTIRGRLSASPAPLNAQELKSDEAILETLAELLDLVITSVPAKLAELDTYLENIGWTGKASSPRVIIFSERKKTLEVLQVHLRKRFKLKDDAVRVFHAGLPDTEQMDIVEDFGKLDTPVRALLATDVASEGVNLHFYCNNLIHYDIPWSLITLEQRNGRIDRYGQDKAPIVAYLMTHPRDPEIRGDLRILDRLIEKEREVNKNIGDAAALLGFHDARAEEEHIEAGFSAGRAPEEIIPDTLADQSFLDLLLGGDGVPSAADYTSDAVALYKDDLTFAKAAFEEVLNDAPDLPQPDFHPDTPSFTFTAPADLRRRCRFVPQEAVPKEWEFLLTTDRHEVQKAIADARRRAKRGETAWPRYQLFWELHPVMQWLLDKVTTHFRRNEAPIILDNNLAPKTADFLFQGVMSNRRSQPVVVEWFSVQWTPTGFSIRTFQDLLERTQFDEGISNPEKDSVLRPTVEQELSKAVDEARAYIRQQTRARHADLERRMKDDEARFLGWHSRSLQQIDRESEALRLSGGTLRKDVHERLESRRRNIDGRLKSRQDWLANTMNIVDQPFVKLAAVFVGE